MATTPSQLDFTQEVQTSTVGDTVSNAPVGSLILFPNGGLWYAKDSSGVVSLLNGVTDVTAADSTVVIAVAGSTRTVRRAAINGDLTIAAASNSATLATVNSNVGSFGTASSVGTFTVNAKGLTTAASNTSILIAESQVTNLVSDLAALTPQTRTLTAGTGLTGGGDLSANRTFNVIANADGSIVANADDIQVGVLATDAQHGARGGGTGHTAATTAVAGFMSSLDKLKVDNVHIDVTATSLGSVQTTNTAAQNITGINAILAAAPNGSTIFFPKGTYDFNAAWTMPASKMWTFKGQGSNRAGSPATAFTVLRWTANVGGDIITLPGSGGGWYTQFRDLTFTAGNSISQSAGAVINVNGNVGTNIQNCAFQSDTGFFFDVLNGSGGSSNSWNSALISNCIIQGYKGTGVRCNSSGSSLVIENCVIQGQWGGTTGTPASNMATAGVSGGWVGALQIMACDILGNINNLLLNPVAASSEVCASVFVNNTYLDNSGGSCLKISGTGATVRARFDTVSFTTAGTNFSTAGTNLTAVEIASTFAYAAGGQGLDFSNCNVLNTFGTTGTSNGFLISGTADFNISGSRIAAWTNGVQVTPISTAGITAPSLVNNFIGATGGFAGNSVGILLNVGGAVYGTIIIQGNSLKGNTSSPMTDNSTLGVNDVRLYARNLGHMAGAGVLPLLSSGGAAIIAGRGAVTSGTAETFLFTVKIPANAVLVGQTFRITALGQSSSTGTLIFRARAGAAGTTADTETFLSITSAAQVANSYATLDLVAQVVALGATSTLVVNGVAIATALVLNETTAAEVITSTPTTAAWFITVTATCSVGTLTVRQAAVEAL